jgi:glutaconyl-CoA decarboxylase
MQTILLLASTEDAAHSHSIIDALPHMAGMLMVLVTLAVLWGVCALTAKMCAIFLPEKKAPAPVQAVQPKPEPPPAADDGISPEILAVIAAAVAAVSGNEPVRIVSIKPTSSSWERAGRQAVLTSHRIR